MPAHKRLHARLSAGHKKHGNTEYNVLTWRELESRLSEHKECSSAQSKDPAHVSGSTGVRLNMGKTNMAMHNAMCPPSRNCLPYTPWPGHCTITSIYTLIKVTF